MGIRLAGYAWSQGGSKQVVYVDDNGHIQELVVQQGQPWSVHDLTSIAGAPVTHIGAIAGYAWSQGGSKQVVYVDDNGHIQELVVQQGQPWSVADLTAIAGAPPAFNTAIAGYDWPQGGSKQVIYVDSNGHIQELVVQQGQPWSVADLTAIAGANLAATENIAAYTWSQGGTKQVVYVDYFGHIWELVVQQGQPWLAHDLTAIAGAPLAVSTAIVGYDWPQGGSKQVIYVDSNGHIQELVVQQGQPWSVADLTSIAGAPPASISSGAIAGAPLDLVWDIFDDNGIPMDPKWRYQKMSLGLGPVLAAPNPAQVCPTLDATCTMQHPTKDEAGVTTAPFCVFGSNTFGVDGHLNWFGATYDGLIFWDNKSAYVEDDDYNFKLSTVDGAGLTTASNGFIGLEFDARETIDHFHTPWWSSFHQAVDTGKAAAQQMVDGRYAFVTGLLGLDCAHNGNTELHPVWAMAIRVNYDLSDQLWAIFVRNWGNEGFCSSNQHYLGWQLFKLRLPWIFGASSVNILNSTQFLTNDSRTKWVGSEFTPNEGVIVTFTLAPPEAQSRINGELHLQWQFPSGAQKPPEPTLVSRSPISGAVTSTPEEKFAALLVQLTPTQREQFLTQLPMESFSPDGIVQPQVTAVQVPHLPVPVATFRPPDVQSVVDDQRTREDQLKIEALRAAFGGQIPRLQ